MLAVPNGSTTASAENPRIVKVSNEHSEHGHFHVIGFDFLT